MKIVYNHKLKLDVCNIFQGEYFIGYNNEIISTVLGSCITVCLYDPINKLGGINHALLPSIKYHKNLSENFYCDSSIINMLEEFRDSGSNFYNLTAKIFGGASFTKGDSIGNKNIKMAKKILNKNNIKIISMDTGGNLSRKLYYQSWTNRVFIKKGNLDE